MCFLNWKKICLSAWGCQQIFEILLGKKRACESFLKTICTFCCLLKERTFLYQQVFINCFKIFGWEIWRNRRFSGVLCHLDLYFLTTHLGWWPPLDLNSLHLHFTDSLHMVFAISVSSSPGCMRFEWYGLSLWMPLVLKSFCSERWCGSSGQAYQGLSSPGLLGLHHEFGINSVLTIFSWWELPLVTAGVWLLLHDQCAAFRTSVAMVGPLAQLLKEKSQHIPLFPVWWDRLGFRDRYSHIKAQLRAKAVLSKGGSNVWVIRCLLCLETTQPAQ